VSTLALEICDAGLLARRDPAGAGPPPASPGYALLDGDVLLTGIEARDRARLKPRRVNTRFWGELDLAPLPQPFPHGVRHADLAHAHLESLWKEVGAGAGEVLLAVPGSYSDDQLGLLLGIARACGLPVAGMVDAALAAASTGCPGGRLVHLDIHLHRTVATELSRGRRIVRHRVETTGQAGLVPLHDAWAQRVAAAFVSHTRFDPLHAASTEQDLYFRLPGLLRRLCGRERVHIQMEAGGKSYAVEIARHRLVEAVETAYAAVVHLVGLMTRAGEPTTLLLSHRAAGLPGLGDRLAGIAGTRIVALEEGAAAEGALAARDAVRSGEEAAAFVLRLPAVGPATEAEPGPRPEAGAASTRPGPTPTHLLHEGRAHPITREPLVLGVAVPDGRRRLNLTGRTAGISRTHCSIYRLEDRVVVEDHSRHGSFLNGQRIEGRAEPRAGDRLRLGTPGVELFLIEAADGDG